MTHTPVPAPGSAGQGAGTPPENPWAAPGEDHRAHAASSPDASTTQQLPRETSGGAAPYPYGPPEQHLGRDQYDQPGPYDQPGQYGPSPTYAEPGPYAQHHDLAAPSVGTGAPGGSDGSGGSSSAGARRGPGWPGVITAAVIAAILATAGAVGISQLVDDSPGTPVSLSGSGSATTRSGGSATEGAAAGSAVDWNDVATKVEPSVATIEVQSSTAEGEGTGVVLDTQGHVLTNNHVATGAGSGAQIRIILSDGRLFNAKVTGTDPQTDLAVLQIQDPPDDLQPANFGDSDKVAVGEPVMAVGNPLGLSDTVTTGIVSATDRPVTTEASESPSSGSSSDDDPFGFGQQQPQQTQSEDVVTNAIQTDAAINPGNSGGPLVNASGAVIGINSSIAGFSSGSSSQSGSIGIGFAIPSSEAKRISAELISTGKASHALLGVSLKGTSGTATTGGETRQAAIVASVTSGGAADKAGLKAGDAIVQVNGKSVPGSESLIARVRAQAPGDTVKLAIVRDGQASQVEVTLGSAPASS